MIFFWLCAYEIQNKPRVTTRTLQATYNIDSDICINVRNIFIKPRFDRIVQIGATNFNTQAIKLPRGENLRGAERLSYYPLNKIMNKIQTRVKPPLGDRQFYFFCK